MKATQFMNRRPRGRDDVPRRGTPRNGGARPAGLCESCGLRPATTTWSQPRAGAPFALCAGCAALIPARTGGRP